MIHNGEVKGLPLVNFRGLKADIEALSGVKGGMLAFGWTTAPDVDGEHGYYDEVTSAWVWGFGGGGGGTSIPIVTSDPVSPADGDLWLLRQTTGAIADGTPIGLLLALTYTGNAGSTAPLQLSVWDDVTNQIVRY